MRRYVIVGIVIVLAFVIGYLPQFLKVLDLEREISSRQESFQAELQKLRERNQALRIHSQLGMLFLEVEENNFGVAKNRSTQLFNEIAEMIGTSRDPAPKEALTAISRQRDALTSDFALASQEAAIKTREMYLQLAEAMGIQ